MIRPLESCDVAPISAVFSGLGWNKPCSQYERYLSEQQQGIRTVFVAFVGEAFAGYVTIVWSPAYPPSRAGRIPAIQDSNVLPHFRRQGIGSSLMDQAAQRVSERSGVGVSSDYGAAQRLYVLRGYVPDGLTLAAAAQHQRPHRLLLSRRRSPRDRPSSSHRS